MKRYTLRALLYALQGIGISLIMSPLFLYWWIHGDYDRYLWIINGPSPYSNFGSGPYQAGLFAGLFAAGLILSFAAAALQRKVLHAKGGR